MDGSNRQSATAWVLAGGVAAGAIAVYVVSKYYGKEVKPSITVPITLLSRTSLRSALKHQALSEERVALRSFAPGLMYVALPST